MKYFIVSILFGSFIFMSCNPTSSDPNLAEIIEEGNTIFIADQTGKKWDVTHAWEEYGMDPKKFQFGLGPNAIRPILSPKMLSEGEAGYPESSNTVLIMGTTLNGYTRAYPISVMSSYEVADEKFGDTYVAVAY